MRHCSVPWDPCTGIQPLGASPRDPSSGIKSLGSSPLCMTGQGKISPRPVPACARERARGGARVAAWWHISSAHLSWWPFRGLDHPLVCSAASKPQGQPELSL